jgi:hypothetical protein
MIVAAPAPELVVPYAWKVCLAPHSSCRFPRVVVVAAVRISPDRLAGIDFSYLAF